MERRARHAFDSAITNASVAHNGSRASVQLRLRQSACLLACLLFAACRRLFGERLLLLVEQLLGGLLHLLLRELVDLETLHLRCVR